MKPIAIAICAAAVLTACGLGQSSLAEVEAARLKTEESFRAPRELTTLPDGRRLYLAQHWIAGEKTPRQIYFVGSTISAIRTTEDGTPQETYVAVAAIGELTVDQKVRKAQMLVNEATRLVNEAREVDEKTKQTRTVPMGDPTIPLP